MLGACVWGWVWATGCGGADCAELCEQAQSCSDSQSSGDCESECAQAQDLAEEADCDGEFDDYVDCVADAADVCTIDEGTCQEEGFAYGFCILGYCQANPSSDLCDDFGGSGCSRYSSGSGDACTVGQLCDGEPDLSLTCDGGAECTCGEDNASVSTVPFDASFCDGDLDDKVSAAAAACGW
jgi:hypothetical protein